MSKLSSTEDWVTVSTTKRIVPQEEEELPVGKLTKQQLRNKKRSEKRKEKKVTEEEPYDELVGEMCSPQRLDSDDETQEIFSSDDDDLEKCRDLERKLRRLTKMRKQIREAREKLQRNDDEQLAAKVARGPSVEADLKLCEEELLQVEDRRTARRVAKNAQTAALARARDADAALMLSVSFDEKFACPICTEVVETAVFVPKACDHTFCRSCLEDHVAKASKPADCVCPLCRKPFCERPSFRVDAKPAAARFRLKHARGRCHCGAEMPLSKLRDHLRQCGPKAYLFPPRRKFGHEFKQPSFASTSSSSSAAADKRRHGINDDPISHRQEQLQLQAALLASISDQ